MYPDIVDHIIRAFDWLIKPVIWFACALSYQKRTLLSYEYNYFQYCKIRVYRSREDEGIWYFHHLPHTHTTTPIFLGQMQHKWNYIPSFNTLYYNKIHIIYNTAELAAVPHLLNWKGVYVPDLIKSVIE